MKNPLVSICIPNYNYEEYLEQSILSALNQNYENFEVIFVDDCSTDNSLEIAMKYKNYIKVQKNHQRLGQPKNTNKAIDLSQGEYIVILHSDDQLLPNFCKKLVPLLTQYPNAVLAVGERMEMIENNPPIKITPFYSTNCIVPGVKQAKVFMMTSFLPCQVLFSKKAFIKSGKINERHIVNLDGLLWFQLCLQGDLAYVREEVAIYRKHHKSTTSEYNKTINHMIEYYCTLTEMFNLAKGNKYLESFFDAAEKRVAELTLRYCHDVIKSQNYELAKQFLRLSTVFDPDITNNQIYKLFNYILTADIDEPINLYYELIKKIQITRNTSYIPPEGYVPLEASK